MQTNIQLIKKIGSGGNGTAYLAEYNNIKMIYKIEKMDEYDKTNPLTSEYYRQIDFNENIAINNPNKFLVLKSHGIIYDCEYKHPGWNTLDKMPEHRKQRFIRKNNQSNCYYLLYYPYLDGDFKSIKNLIYDNSQLYIDFMYQIIDSINIMRKKSYSQNDISQQNLMYKKINELQYQWYIIDYGNILKYNNQYPTSKLDEDIRDRPNYGQDLLQFIGKLMFGLDNIGVFLETNNIIRPSDNVIENYIKKHKKYKIIKKFMPKKENDIKILESIFNKHTILILITTLIYPRIILQATSVEKKLIKEFKNKQLYPKLIAYYLKHFNDKNYDKVLDKIKILAKIIDN